MRIAIWNLDGDSYKLPTSTVSEGNHKQDSTQWYYCVTEGQVDGPVSIIYLKQAITNGTLHEETPVCMLGSEEWTLANEALAEYGSNDQVELEPETKTQIKTKVKVSEKWDKIRRRLSAATQRVGYEMHEIAGATYEKGRLEVNVRLAKKRIAIINKEIERKLMRDYGARAMVEMVDITGDEVLLEETRNKQRTYELANQASIAGDKQKAKEAKAAAKEINELHIRVGKAAHEKQVKFPGSDEFADKWQTLEKERRKLEEEVASLQKSLDSIPSEKRKRIKYGYTAAAAVVAILALILFISFSATGRDEEDDYLSGDVTYGEQQREGTASKSKNQVEKITWSIEDKENISQQISDLSALISLFENELAFDVGRLGAPIEINDSDSEFDKIMKKDLMKTRDAINYSIGETRRILSEKRAELHLAEDKLDTIEKYLNSQKK